MPYWLLNRLFEAQDQSKPRFAFQGTINWMRALAEVVNSTQYTDDILSAKYARVARRAVNPNADTKVFENILMAYHNLASLNAINADITHHYNTCTSAIIAWYYSTYFCCSAMIAASSGSTQENHAKTAKAWQAEIVLRDFVPYPFNLYLSSLVTSAVESEVAAYRGTNTFFLNTYPENTEQARGAIVSYLQGTSEYEKCRIEEKVKASREFRNLGVDNFRTRDARELRDSILNNRHINYLSQAIRYRGKANYRDSIFLSYGDDNEEKINKFPQDLLDVSKAFIRMTSFYVSKRVECGSWDLFVSDLEDHSRLSIDVDDLKI